MTRVDIPESAKSALTHSLDKLIVTVQIPQDTPVRWEPGLGGYEVSWLLLSFEGGDSLSIWSDSKDFPLMNSTRPFEAFIIGAEFLHAGQRAQKDHRYENCSELVSLLGQSFTSFEMLSEQDDVEDHDSFLVEVGVRFRAERGPVEFIAHHSRVLPTWLGVRAPNLGVQRTAHVTR